MVQTELPVNIDGAAEATGLAKVTIYRKASAGNIPCYKQGHKLFFFRSELIEWIRQGKRKSKQEIDTAVDNIISSHK